jgi:small-conductance mechanosensitive channel
MFQIRNYKCKITAVFFSILIFVIIFFGFGLQTQAQNTESDLLNPVEVLDSKANLVQIKQLTERELRNSIITIESEKAQIEKDVINLRSKRDELRNTQQRLNQLKIAQENNEFVSTSDEIPVIQNLQPDIDKISLELLEVEKELAQKQSRLEALQSNLFLTQQQLGEKSQETEYALVDLRTQLLGISSKYSIYFLLVVSFFVGLQLLHIALDKLIQNEPIRDILKFISTTLVIIATIITLLFAFVGNLTYLLTGLGVISAALVVALQDFVSSFFAFMWIKFKSVFKTRDIIHISTPETKITGIVANIGIFRTTLRELVGDNQINSERPSGRVVSVPNSVVLKTPVINYTQDNRLLWHSFSVTITFESNFEKAQEILDSVAQKQFEYALDHKDQLLDDAYNLKYLYRPKVFMSIADNGPIFEIWFATRYGHYYEVLQTLSSDILKELKTHGINLAYTTSRVIPTPQDSSVPVTTGNIGNGNNGH